MFSHRASNVPTICPHWWFVTKGLKLSWIQSAGQARWAHGQIIAEAIFWARCGGCIWLFLGLCNVFFLISGWWEIHWNPNSNDRDPLARWTQVWMIFDFPSGKNARSQNPCISVSPMCHTSPHSTPLACQTWTSSTFTVEMISNPTRDIYTGWGHLTDMWDNSAGAAIKLHRESWVLAK